MEDELIIQQNEYEKRTPKENTLLWFDKYSQMYETLSDQSNPLESFSKLVIVKSEIAERIENAKTSLKDFSTELDSILVDEKKLERGSYLEQLHHNISLCCQLTFTDSTIGNFQYGGMSLSKPIKEIKKIERKFPEHLHLIKPLQEIVAEYIQLTDQKKKGGLVIKIPKAYEIRFLTDKLHYQKISLNLLIERLLLYDYPAKVPTLTTLEIDRLEKFLAKNHKKRRASPSELYMDIYYLIKRLQKDENNPYLFKKGKLVYSVATGIALDDHVDSEEQAFAKKWKKTEINPNGISKSWLEKKIKEIYEEVIIS